MPKNIRIFQIAKDLNISHTDILTFLKKKGLEVASHMTPVDEDTQEMIQVEFHKERQDIDRFRKEQVRREIHQTRVDEQQKTQKKLNLLSLDEQRSIERKEKQNEEKKEKEKAAAKNNVKVEQNKKEGIVDKEDKVEAKEEKKTKAKQHKLRKIDLSEIKSQIGTVNRKPVVKKDEDGPASQSAKEAVKQTLASMDKKSKKKVYKKGRKQDLDEILDEDDVKNIKIPEYSSVDELAKFLDVEASDVIQECISLGKLATINQRLDWDMIEMLAETFGYQAEAVEDVAEELFSLEETDEDIKNAVHRPPVVTIMGHVDHGKTSLLDYIRDANVVAGESGGITQHTGAYQVDLPDNNRITFLDTPGHEAFTAMRARGAQVTDIVVLVVAANDGVMPQTVEAINHAKAASVPLVVAINKIDLPDNDPERVKRELSENDVLLEDWGGKIQGVEISAKEGTGIKDLLQSILVEAEVLELKANQDTLARGTVIDSKLDKGYGPVATVLIQKGTLNVGDPFICNNYSGRVRAIMDERGNRAKLAMPADAVQILGFDQVPQSADIFSVLDDAKDLKRLAAERQRTKREIDQRRIKATTLDSISAKIKEGAVKTLPLVIKGDVDGSIEALSQTLEKIKNDEVGVQVIHKSVGLVTESDVLLAAASGAVIIAFHVQVDSNAKLQARQEGVDIRSYSVIYNAEEEVKLALEGLLEPEKIEEVLGRAVVLEMFKLPKLGFIAGTKVEEGIIKRGAKARLIRDDQVIHEGSVTSLKRFKDDVKEIKEGMECGIGIDGAGKFKEDDIIVTFEVQSIKRTLEL